MPRILNDQPCILTLNDRISGSKITLHYELPTSEERIEYSNSLVTRNGSQIEYNHSETRAKYGLKILRGFNDGDFAKAVDKPISSRPDSPDYDPDWKKYVSQYGSDIVEMLAIHVFELSVVNEPPAAGGKKGKKGEKVKDPF